ncbi:hypothetical protein CBR_g31876 [Chara braunii]|uniref:Uncharacterized protein n=1 Tax=Chara braunii TaxID=69332 RepID=A0A388LFW8_CHABU|nr:hypothetical protein CBR_g31876 [Chara braunii]|eukprot:GBG81204.1 hypothetical protein CBR_g31876 [Chara braunii]
MPESTRLSSGMIWKPWRTVVEVPYSILADVGMSAELMATTVAHIASTGLLEGDEDLDARAYATDCERFYRSDESDCDSGDEDDEKDMMEGLPELEKDDWANDDQFEDPPGPSPSAIRLLLLIEIMAACGFSHSHTLIEYWIHFDTRIWQCRGELSAPLYGCTQLSSVYTRSDDEQRRPIAHFSHLIELQLESQQDPGISWPIMYLKAASCDSWHIYRVEGYGYLSLAGSCPGSRTHIIDTWKPEGCLKSRLHSMFVGGSAELKDITFVRIPSDFKV